MEFHQLEAFVAVAALRSFSRAAERLYLSQPTVSAHIKSLESEMGTLLFDRGKSDLTMTEAGKTLYRYARDILDLRTVALSEVQKGGGAEDAELTVAASSVPCQYLLPRAIAAFEQKHTGITVSLRQENSRQACHDVFEYHYPLGIVGEKVNLPRLVYQPLLRDELVLAIPNRDEYRELISKKNIALSDITGYRLLFREPGSGTRSLFEDQLHARGISLTRYHITVFDNQETIKQAVRQGLGLTVVSRYVVEDYETFGVIAVRPLDGLELTRDVYLVYHERRVLSPAAKSLLAFIQDYFREGF